MNDLMMDAARRGVRYVKSLTTRKLYPSSEAIERLQELDRPLQDDPADPLEVLEILDTIGSPATVASTSGRYFGFVIGPLCNDDSCSCRHHYSLGGGAVDVHWF
ncbi:MAG: hypothetical protein U9R72_03200 [Chloroflexota bacterium]|nr:hypothetical protein [Chloroflexota bacterium]